MVDIRGANLNHNYNVWIKQQPQGRSEGGDGSPKSTVEVENRGAGHVTNVVQSIGSVLVMLLTIQKLWEEVRFIRYPRQSGGGGDPYRLPYPILKPYISRPPHSKDRWGVHCARSD